MIRALVTDKPRQWDSLLPQAEFAYNSMLNRSTGKSPFAIVYTKPLNQTLDLADFPNTRTHASHSLAESIVQTHQDVCQHLEAANARYKAAADKHRREKIFSPGDLVMIHLRRECFPVGTYHKLQAKKFGPFPVKQKIGDNAYIIDLPADWQISSTFNVADIFVYHPPDDAPIVQDLSESSPSHGRED